MYDSVLKYELRLRLMAHVISIVLLLVVETIVNKVCFFGNAISWDWHMTLSNENEYSFDGTYLYVYICYERSCNNQVLLLCLSWCVSFLRKNSLL